MRSSSRVWQAAIRGEYKITYTLYGYQYDNHEALNKATFEVLLWLDKEGFRFRLEKHDGFDILHVSWE